MYSLQVFPAAAYPKRTPSNNYLPFYLFFFSQDLHHYKIFAGLLRAESLPHDCNVYLCTVLNPRPAALHLSPCSISQGSGPAEGSQHLLMEEGQLGSLRPWALATGPSGMEKRVKNPCPGHPLDLEEAALPPGPVDSWPRIPTQGAPFATGSLGATQSDFPCISEPRESEAPWSIWVPQLGLWALLALVFSTPLHAPCFSDSMESSLWPGTMFLPPLFFPKPLAQSWVINSELTVSIYCLGSLPRKHSLIRSFLP